MYFFGSVKFNGFESRGITRLFVTAVCTAIFEAIIALPICGILYLIK